MDQHRPRISMFSRLNNSKLLWFVLGLGIILTGWQIAATYIDASIILPPPSEVVGITQDLLSTPRFWVSAQATILRVLEGFSISLIVSIILGLSGGLSNQIRSLISPFILFMQSVPVLSVILILLVWFGSQRVPVITPILMTLPVMTQAVIEGVRGVDPLLIQMADSYQVPLRRQIRHIYLPSLFPGLFAGASASLGLSWKVAIAAEVLAQPNPGIGTAMQRAKTFLETGEVFAWTLVAVVLSGITQGIFTLLARTWRHHGRSR
jgi:NitT/TauT family transport system permease protein